MFRGTVSIGRIGKLLSAWNSSPITVLCAVTSVETKCIKMVATAAKKACSLATRCRKRAAPRCMLHLEAGKPAHEIQWQPHSRAWGRRSMAHCYCVKTFRLPLRRWEDVHGVYTGGRLG
ncbi:unnamed protein product [Chondrus crispus]|uniref:Uncharacterized protein n=1 Tax=Chondrus crispus TaxID=2769 RepID=R7Q7J7_CHOCR|nr:unnamed protein product [Chondrus crispus]CDF33366.1 unnamed protein product [Chondrus crispus]|eukprot:XP_005713169.1 unnamed protein product [Chondrus crispus]